MSENDDELDKLVQAEKIGSTVPTYLPTYLRGCAIRHTGAVKSTVSR